jgi:hypothetical protein
MRRGKGRREALEVAHRVDFCNQSGDERVGARGGMGGGEGPLRLPVSLLCKKCDRNTITSQIYIKAENAKELSHSWK